jgi:hypothetical protein
MSQYLFPLQIKKQQNRVVNRPRVVNKPRATSNYLENTSLTTSGNNTNYIQNIIQTGGAAIEVKGSSSITTGENVNLNIQNATLTGTGTPERKVYIDAPELQGYYQWTWGSVCPETDLPTGTNMVVIFTGWGTASLSLSNGPGGSGLDDYFTTYPSIDTYLCIGGGNSNGTITPAVIADFITNIPNIQNITLAHIKGIVFDIEYMNYQVDPDIPNAQDWGTYDINNVFTPSDQMAFNALDYLFAQIQNTPTTSNGTTNFKVIVTIAHSGAFDGSVTEGFIQLLLTSTAIDYLSPQLYPDQPASYQLNDYQPGLYPWSNWNVNSVIPVPKIAPSLSADASGNNLANYYSEAQTAFNTNGNQENYLINTNPLGITLAGCIQWNPVVSTTYFLPRS